MKNSLLAFSLVVLGSLGLVSLTPTTVLADACGDEGKILSIKPWYYGLTDADCAIKSPGAQPNEQRAFFGRIIINIVDGILQVAAYVAVGFVIYGGFVFMTSSGDPNRATAGRKTLINSVIGLVIALSAVTLVNFIGQFALGI